MFSSTHQTSLNYSHKKESPAQKLLNHTRAVFRQSQSDPVEKPFDRGFVRLDSLEGACFTHKMSQQHQPSLSPSHESLMDDMDLKQPPTKAEMKWFGNYNSHSLPNVRRRSFRENPSTPSSFSQSFYNSGFCFDSHPAVQTPYNLTKGQFECWTMDPTHQEAYFQVFSPTNGFEYQEPMDPMQSAVSFVGGIVGMVFGGYSTTAATPSATASSVQKNSDKPSSTLNPNAKVFTPQLNPNAKEFTPAKRDEKKDREDLSSPLSSSTPNSTTKAAASVTPPRTTELAAAATLTPSESFSDEKLSRSEQKKAFNDSGVCAATDLTPTTSARVTPQPPVCVTPEMEEPLLKATSERLCTPWVPSVGVAKVAVDETDEETFECDIDDFTSDSEDDDDDVDDCDEFALKSDICDESKDCYRRQRSLSSCSDESYIEFTASSPGESPVVNCDKSRNVAAVAEDDVDSDDESDESGGDDEDWDEIDQSDANVDLDETMSNFGLVCPLFVPALTNGSAQTAGGGSADSSAQSQKSSKRFVIETVAAAAGATSRPVDDVHPASLNQTSKDDVERRIRDANDTWSQSYHGYDVCERRSTDAASSKRTKFTPQDEWETIDEDPALADDLRLARTSDLSRRKADHERMERLLGPVFQPDHRAKMWSVIHSGR